MQHFVIRQKKLTVLYQWFGNFFLYALSINQTVKLQLPNIFHVRAKAELEDNAAAGRFPPKFGDAVFNCLKYQTVKRLKKLPNH